MSGLRELAEKVHRDRYGEELRDFVARLRGEGVSWRVIAGTVNELVGSNVTHQTLVNWYGESIAA